jgi:hypothetical protein
MLSVAASGLFIAYKSKSAVLPAVLPANMTVLGVNRIDWAVLVALAIINCLAIVYAYVARAWQFTHLAAREVTEIN